MVTFRKLTYASVLLLSDVNILAACLTVILLFRYALFFISEVPASFLYPVFIILFCVL
jgi:hypothetical protein